MRQKVNSPVFANVRHSIQTRCSSLLIMLPYRIDNVGREEQRHLGEDVGESIPLSSYDGGHHLIRNLGARVHGVSGKEAAQHGQRSDQR